MSNALIRKAIGIAGSQCELARRCGKKQGHVSYWLKADRVTAEVAILIEGATGGSITRYQLRPDVFGRPDQTGFLAAGPAPIPDKGEAA